jgi:hypothetical protein
MDNSKIRVGLENSNAIVCEACENETFIEANYLRRVSKLLTGSPEDMIVPVPTFLCSKCGHINPNFRISEPKVPESKIKLSE